MGCCGILPLLCMVIVYVTCRNLGQHRWGAVASCLCYVWSLSMLPVETLDNTGGVLWHLLPLLCMVIVYVTCRNLGQHRWGAVASCHCSLWSLSMLPVETLDNTGGVVWHLASVMYGHCLCYL